MYHERDVEANTMEDNKVKNGEEDERVDDSRKQIMEEIAEEIRGKYQKNLEKKLGSIMNLKQ